VPVLHAVFIDLRPEADPAPVLAAARALRTVPGVLDGGTVRADAAGSTHDAGLWVLLPGRPALEAFGASEPLMRFLREALAPVLSRMESGDFEVAASPPAGAAALLFGATARHGVFAWQWERAAASLRAGASTGASAGDRSRFDFGGIVTFADRLDLEDWLVGWPGEIGPLASSIAWVAGWAQRWEAAP
jgi:hypothetical protein